MRGNPGTTRAKRPDFPCFDKRIIIGTQQQLHHCTRSWEHLNNPLVQISLLSMDPELVKLINCELTAMIFGHTINVTT